MLDQIGGLGSSDSHCQSAPSGAEVIPPAAPIDARSFREATTREPVTGASRETGSIFRVDTHQQVTLSPTISAIEAPASRVVNAVGCVPGASVGETGSMTIVITGCPVSLSPTVSALAELQTQRTHCIKSQSRADRSTEALIARYLGYSSNLDAKERLALFKRASAARKAVEKGGEVPPGCASQAATDLSALTPIILLSAQSREAWDKHRNQTEKQMRKLARTLPVWPWVEQIRGFGDLGLAIIVAEAGDLSNYATKERVWKRLGLAVIAGERQQKKTGAEAAAAHGYSPRRRAEIWTLLSDAMFRHQWRGAKEGEAAGPAGPYGEVYASRKAHTETREWTLAHRHNDARRVMSKALIADLWKQWRAARHEGAV